MSAQVVVETELEGGQQGHAQGVHVFGVEQQGFQGFLVGRVDMARPQKARGADGARLGDVWGKPGHALGELQGLLVPRGR